MESLFHFIVLLCAFSSVECTYFQSRVSLDKEKGGYVDLTVEISSELKASDCPRILEDIKATFTDASESLYKALDQQVYFASIDILVPQNWTASDCGTPLNLPKASGRQYSDFLIGRDHPVYKSSPWTQQSLGCGRHGDFVYVPASFISPSQVKSLDRLNVSGSEETDVFCGDDLRDRWLQYRYGVFSTDLDRVPLPSSLHDSVCMGRSPREIIMTHSDFKGLSKSPADTDNSVLRAPQFMVSRIEPPRYVIVLENTSAMNHNNLWEFIRTALKKFIMYDLPSDAKVGIVLFNEGAYIAHTMRTLATKDDRTGLTVQIENRFSLNQKVESCLRCGFIKAIEVLHTSGPNVGATFILVSQGKPTSLSSDSEKDLTNLARRHRIQVYSIAIPVEPYTDLSLSLERFTFNSGGLSFYVTQKSSLMTYVGLLDSLREIQRRTQIAGPYLIHNQYFDSFGPSEETGSFIIDRYIGRNTFFNCFALNPTNPNTDNAYVKGLKLEDPKGKKFFKLDDSAAHYNSLSVYGVPFESDQNIGMNWTYTLDRLAAPLQYAGANLHVIQVTSRPRNPDEFINIHFFTNLNAHSTEASVRRPIQLFVEVKLNGVPILDAKVKVFFEIINLRGEKISNVMVDLFDNGNGDPDLHSNDGVYSRYLTDLSHGEGRYVATVQVDDNGGRAFSYQKEKSYRSSSCCKGISELVELPSFVNQKLGSFRRIVSGDSFRINSIRDLNTLPPSRVLDLVVNLHQETHEVEFQWTAPGDDYDKGQVKSYKLYSSLSSELFYSNLNETSLVEEIQATKPAGRRESYRIKVVDFNRNIFYAISAIDEDNNAAFPSNIRAVLMPSPEAGKFARSDDTSALTQYATSDDEVIVTNHKKPEKFIVFLALGVLAFVLVCIISVILIVLVNRKKKPADGFVSAEGSDYGDNDEQKIYCGSSYNTISATVCNEQSLGREYEKSQFLTSSYQHDSSGSYRDHNRFATSMMHPQNTGWVTTLTPEQHLHQFPQQNLNYHHQQLPHPPPLYAVPIPKSQRSRMTDIFSSSPRTPTSSLNSAGSQNNPEEQNQAEPIYSNETLQKLLDTLTEEFANENAMSYLEGTNCDVNHQFYSNVYNSDERLSQSSSAKSNGNVTPQNSGTIKSILKKRDQSSTEFLGSRSSSNSSQTSQDSEQEKLRETEERLWADLSPTRVILETSYEARQELRPPVIQELTEEEDETTPDSPADHQTSSDNFPPPPTLGELQASQETMTPVKSGDQVLLDRKVRTITQV